jgi:hypothetical protein
MGSFDRDGHNQQFTIGAFPHSEADRRKNRFFLDLLRPTFGRQIAYGVQDRNRLGWRGCNQIPLLGDTAFLDLDTGQEACQQRRSRFSEAVE